MNATRRTVLIAGALSAITALSVSSAVFAASDLVEVQSLNAANKPITVTVPKNPQRVAVADFSVLDTLDHTHLDRQVAHFAERTSTAENIVVYLWGQLAPRFEGRLAHLRLWETRNNSFEYSGERP